LNTHLSLEIAVAVIGLPGGLFDQATSTIVIVFAILTVLLMPPFFRLSAPDSPEKEQPNHLIFGTANLGITVAQQLDALRDIIQFVVLDPAERQTLIKTDYLF
jgi:hypothetical protein